MLPNVAIYGGFVGTENLLTDRVLTYPSSTTLSGDIDNDGTSNGNSSHIIYSPPGLTTTAVLNGFVIKGGNGERGAAMYNDQCSPLIKNCLFAENVVTNYGGAIFNNAERGSSSPTFVNCGFRNNSAGYGGAMLNHAYLSGTSNPTFVNCAFEDNRASAAGGGLYNNGGYSGNSSPVFTNCSFRGNTAPGGGAMYNAGTSSGTSRPTMTNSIVFGNANTFANNGNAGITATYSLFDANSFISDPTNRTTTVSPFISASSVALSNDSPAINAGDNTAYSTANGPTTDLVGQPRTSNNVIDMGAVELQSVTAAAPTRLYVNAAATGTADGLTWATAFTDLQQALTYADVSNLTEIWVAGGTYKPTPGTDRTVSFAMLPNVAIYGGFAGTEQNLTDRVLTYPGSTTLSGDIGTAGDNTDNSYHVVNNPSGLTTTAILDGFVITGGNADGGFPDDSGAGMYNSSSSPTIRNCMFRSNTAGGTGGAMFNDNQQGASSPVCINCSFQDNHATNGGAVFNKTFGGNNSPTFVNCSFQGNSAGSGGAIYITGNSGTTNCKLINCVLFNNGGANTFVNFGNGNGSFITATYSLFDVSVDPTTYTSDPTNLTTKTSRRLSRARPAWPLTPAPPPSTRAAVPATRQRAARPPIWPDKPGFLVRPSTWEPSSGNRLRSARPSSM